MSMKTIVNMSDAQISDNPADILVTYSLGSCIGVSLYDPSNRIGGMLHYQLPASSMDPERAKKDPFMFADTGMKKLVDKMLAKGANKKRLQIKIAGGAAMNNGPAGFDIGKRNFLALRKICWMNSLFIDGEDIGGSAPRNMYLRMTDGAVTVKCNGTEKNL